MTIKEIWKILMIIKEVKKAMSEVKSGVTSSELYVTIATIAASVFSAIAGMIPPELMTKIVLVAGCIYTICRTIVKLTPSKIDDELLDKIAEKFKKDN